VPNKDFNDGYFGHPSNNNHTYDYQQGRRAYDKQFGTNYSGLILRNPSPIRRRRFSFRRLKRLKPRRIILWHPPLPALAPL
jgi:hypothetical protein